MKRDGITLAEISYELASKTCAKDSLPPSSDSTINVSVLVETQKDFLKILNLALNAGDFEACHLFSRRRFSPGKDNAGDDDTLWVVEGEEIPKAYNVITSALPPDHPIYEKVAEQLTEPMRRLRRLLELGGTSVYRDGQWRFTKIKQLIDAEIRDGRGRCSEKTVRADLTEAAEAEVKLFRTGELTRASTSELTRHKGSSSMYPVQARGVWNL